MSTNRITITGDHLVIEPVGLNKLWSLTRRLQFSLDHVRGATYDPGMKNEPKGRRGPGLRVPGKLAGTFHDNKKNQFWNISVYDRAIVITLDPTERFDRVVITVDDPHEVVQVINSAIGSR